MKPYYLRRILISLMILAALLIAGRQSFWASNLRERLTVHDVDREAIFRLTTVANPAKVKRVDILIDGSLDGRAQVFQLADGQKTDVHTIGPGKISQRMGGPWNLRTYTLKYEPESASSGELKIKYRFKG